MTETWDLEGTVVEATGWTGRVLEFAADGTETVSYDATPVEAEGPAGPASSTWSGTATYTVATAGGTLTFTSVDFSAASVTDSYAGSTDTTQPDEVPPDPVTYTCDETTHTQRSDTYEATFTRLD